MKPPPVSRSAVPIRRHRCRSGPADSLCTSAGTSRRDSRHPEGPATPASSSSAGARPLRRRSSSSSLLHRTAGLHVPSVSFAPSPWSFCTGCCSPYPTVAPGMRVPSLCRRTEPPVIAGRPLRPMPPLPEPTSGLPVPCSCSTAKPRAKRPFVALRPPAPTRSRAAPPQQLPPASPYRRPDPSFPS
jgi:hypothetical protein